MFFYLMCQNKPAGFGHFAVLIGFVDGLFAAPTQAGRWLGLALAIGGSS